MRLSPLHLSCTAAHHRQCQPAVEDARARAPVRVRPPGFRCRQPCQLSKLVNLLCRSIFFRPPLFLSSSSHLLLCYRGNQPDRKHGQSKKARSVGHDLRTRAVPRRRGEEAGHRAEHTKHPLYNSGRSAQRCSRRDRPPSLSHVLQKVTPTEKRPRKNVPREQRRRRRRRRSRERREDMLIFF